MNYINDKLKVFLEKIKANKRLMYLSLVSVLVLFCLVLNVTFSFLTNSFTSGGANVIVGDLKYRMVINEVELDESVGTKKPTNTITGDRIIYSKASKTEIFNIELTSLNNTATKYEIIYKVCTDVNCTSFIDEVTDLIVSYKVGSENLVNGSINANTTKQISIVTRNNSNNNYYIQVDLNVGYIHNELSLINQITTPYDPAVNGNLNIVSYVSGIEADSFPTEPNYETSVKCTYSDGSVASARGVLTYNNGWKLNVYNIDETATTCRIDFEEVLYVTYDILSTRYKCANQNTDVSSSDAILIYSGNCSTLKSDDGGWRLSFLSNGTLTVSGLIYIDAFLVGGGGGGNGSYGGTGGNTYYKSSIRLSNQGETYSATLGGGGNGGNAGGATSLNIGSTTYLAAGGAAGGSGGNGAAGVCEFLETANGGCKYTDNGYSGYYAGNGGYGGDCWNSKLGGTGGGGRGCVGGGWHCSSPTLYTGVANTGGGGGGGGNCGYDNCWNEVCNWIDYTLGPSAGGSGVIVIRNTRG